MFPRINLALLLAALIVYNLKLQTLSQECRQIGFDVNVTMVQKYGYEFCTFDKLVKVGNGAVNFTETQFTGCTDSVSVRAHAYSLKRNAVQLTAGEQKTVTLQEFMKDKENFRICAVGNGCSRIEGNVCF